MQKKTTLALLVGTALLGATSAAACSAQVDPVVDVSKNANEPGTSESTDGQPPNEPQVAPQNTATGTPTAYSDGQVAGLLEAISRINIAEADVARRRAWALPVQAYANRVLADHAVALASTQTLMSGLRLTLLPSARSDELLRGSAAEVSDLGTYDARAFDVRFLDSQRASQSEAMELLERVITSGTSASELVDRARLLRAILADHAAQARELSVIVRDVSRDSSLIPNQW